MGRIQASAPDSETNFLISRTLLQNTVTLLSKSMGFNGIEFYAEFNIMSELLKLSLSTPEEISDQYEL